MPSPETREPGAPELVYTVASRTLVAGFVACAALILVAVIIAGARGEALGTDTIAFADLPDALRDGDATAFAQLGIFAIVLTPVVTTIGMIVGFLRAGDRRFAGVSALVLIVLVASMVIALAR